MSKDESFLANLLKIWSRQCITIVMMMLFVLLPLSFIITLAKVVPVVERWDEGKSDLQVNDR